MMNILIPTDFSENAYHAMRYATYIFEKEECTFYILNAFQNEGPRIFRQPNKELKTSLAQSTKEASEKKLAELFNTIKLENDNPKHIFKSLSIADSLVRSVSKTVIDYSIYYIIMGTKGASGLKRIFLGSNTVKVLSKIDFCPIIAVPVDSSFDIPETILFATGFEHVYGKYELHPMVVLAKLWNSQISVLHLIENEKKEAHQETAKKIIKKRLHQVPYEIIEIEKKDKVSSEIAAHVEQHEEIGMMAIIGYWHSFMEKLIQEPVVKTIAFKTKVPLLVMHMPD